MIASIWIKLWCSFAGKKSIPSFTFSLRYCKDITIAILGFLGMPGYTHPKGYYHLVEHFRVYLQAKNQLHPTRFCGDITKIRRILILVCKKIRCLSVCQKRTSSFTFFLRYYILKNPSFDWPTAFWPITREP